MSEGEFALLLAFDTDDLEFRRGFEAGILWQILRCLPPEVTRLDKQIGTDNLEMVLRMADAEGWAVKVEAIVDEDGTAYDEWTAVVLERL